MFVRMPFVQENEMLYGSPLWANCCKFRMSAKSFPCANEIAESKLCALYVHCQHVRIMRVFLDFHSSVVVVIVVVFGIYFTCFHKQFKYNSLSGFLIRCQSEENPQKKADFFYFSTYIPFFLSLALVDKHILRPHTKREQFKQF